MTQPFETALDVCEHVLEQTGKAMLEGDFASFLPNFRLPLEIQTFDGRRLLNTPEDIQTVFEAVRMHYSRNGVTDVVRRCVEASFIDPATVISMHETRLISGNVITQNPFVTLSTLKFNGEFWQVASTSYAIDDRAEHNAALMSAGTDHSSNTFRS